MATTRKDVIFHFETDDTAIEYEASAKTLWLYDLTDSRKLIGSVCFSSVYAQEFINWVESFRKDINNA